MNNKDATMPKDSAPVLLPAPATPAAATPPPTPHEEPRAGGNYLRDPVTGALTPNPAHPESNPAPLE